MGDWWEVRRAADARHYVANLALALQLGVSAATFHRRTAAEGWARPFARVRVSPEATSSAKTDLMVVTDAATAPTAACGHTAAWLHGVRDRPPSVREVIVPHGAWRPTYQRTAVRAARWFGADDVDTIDAVPVLRAATLPLTADGWSERDLRALLIDLVHHGHTDVAEMDARAAEAGPIAGIRRLRRLLERLGELQIESVFHDDVLRELQRRGYRPPGRTTRIATPDGRGLSIDIALPWCVAVEPEGDRYHSGRDQRRADRRRLAQYAGTPWVPVPIDWRDGQAEPEGVLAAIDAAVLAQWDAGHGRDTPLPPHLRSQRAS